MPFEKLYRRWYLAFLLAVFLSANAIAADPKQEEAGKDAKPVVSLTLDFGDGFQKRYDKIEWKEGLTIADALEFAAAHKRGIALKKRGAGAAAFLLEIDGLANGTDDKYWIYEVNGEKGETSYALAKLRAGDAVLWRFGTWP